MENTHKITSIISLFSGESARQGYLAAFDQGIISISNFAATLLLARNASPTELGVFGVGFTVLKLIRSIQEGIIIQPLNSFGAGLDQEEFNNYFSNTALLQILLALTTSMGTILVGWMLTLTGNDVAGPGLISLWAAFLFWQLLEYVRRTLYTRARVPSAVTTSIISNTARIGIMLWLIIQGNITGTQSLLAIGFGALIALLPGIWFTRRYWQLITLDLISTWKENWKFGRWILGSTTSNWLALEFYPILTAGIVSFAAAGAYRALQNLVAPIHVLLRAADTFLTPKGAKIYDDLGINNLSNTIKTAYIILALPVLGWLGIALLFPNMMLELFYGETYLPYASGIIFMVIFYFFLFLSSPVNTAFKSVRIGKPIFVANLVAIITMFTLGIFLILNWGLYGTFAGQALNALIVCVFLWASWRVFRQTIS